MLDALPAVTVPSAPNAGLSFRSFSSLNRLGCSSSVMDTVALAVVSATGTISRAKMPRDAAAMGQQVGGAGHALHSARHDNRSVVALDRLGGQHDRLEPRAAYFSNRRSRDGVGKTRADACLTRGVLPRAGGQYVSHDHFINTVGRDAGTFERGADNGAAQRSGRHVGQRTVEAADGRPHRAGEIDFFFH
jgi:hypothetical protein